MWDLKETDYQEGEPLTGKREGWGGVVKKDGMFILQSLSERKCSMYCIPYICICINNTFALTLI